MESASKPLTILSIETSCDETALSVLQVSGTSTPHFTILSNELVSQIDIHREFGGVFPAIAKREHAKAIFPLFIKALADAGLHKEGTTLISEAQSETITTLFTHEQELCTLFIKELSHVEKPDIDCIAVTTGPGLEPALWVGVNFARALSYIWNIPIVPVNHMEGHVMSVIAQKNGNTFEGADIAFPALSLLVSGGHTELVLIRDWMHYEKIGQTKDDAVGEAFDKVARMIGLPYPGGPEISKLAHQAREEKLTPDFEFPRPMMHSGDYSFSYSGLKTSALYWLRDHKLSAAHVNPLAGLPSGLLGTQNEPPTLEDFCTSFEQAIVDVLVGKTLKAAREYKPKSILLVGGVSANRKLRETLDLSIQSELPGTIFLPSVGGYSMDNGAMIAVAGYYKLLKHGATPWQDLDVDPNWRVDAKFRE